MKQVRTRQQGLTMISWLVVGGIGIFFIMLGVKLIPVYLDHYSLRNVLETVQNEPNPRALTPRTIRKLIKRRLSINGVYDFDQKNIKISKKKGRTVVDVNYEVRIPMAGNIQALVSFSESVSL